ncbi:filamentous hemagglutinin N-terminal domain-containing protein [Geitlerinema sp. CS-897]|nr:filamentous hemagglutinin N-terminal domain-containing protein [Geitlerinema sp. CS-897]
MWNVAGSVAAQVVPDATLPSNSVVSLDDNTFVIEGGTAVNGNLFHSFEQFSIPTDGGALFNNGVGIENIFSRVTGSSISEIDGVLGANGTANLFFLNPNGIVFGPNARLELGGSFVASTADSVVFENGVEFSASSPQMESLLVVDIPVGLRLRDTPGSIVNRSRAESSDGSGFGLQVPPGEMLALVGGDILFESGGIFTIGGTVEVGGLAEAGIVQLNEDGSLRFSENILRSNIILEEDSFITNSPSRNHIASIFVYGNDISLSNSILAIAVREDLLGEAINIGDITINSTGEVRLNSSSIFNQILVSSNPEKNGGDISIVSNRLTLENNSGLDTNLRGQGISGDININSNSLEIFDRSAISSYIEESGNGVGGNIDINSNSIFLEGGGQISTGIFSDNTQNTGGNIAIDTQNLEITNTPIDGETNGQSGVFANIQDNSSGRAGNIQVNTRRLLIADGSRIASGINGGGNGFAGNVDITAEDIHVQGVSIPDGTQSAIDSSIDEGGSGEGGNVQIEASLIEVFDGGQILTSILGNGNAGNLTIQADRVEAIGSSSFNGSQSGIFSNVLLNARGNAGDLTITSGSILVADGAAISSGLEDTAIGRSGNMIIVADTIEVTGLENEVPSQLGTTSNFNTVGNAGSLSIEASQINVLDGGQISSSNLGDGDAGSMSVRADNLVVSDGGAIATLTANSGEGGMLTIKATESISLSGNRIREDGRIQSSGISSATQGSGNAGALQIRANRISIQDGAVIVARSAVNSTGNAGNLLIQAPEITIRGENPQGAIEGNVNGSFAVGGVSGISTAVEPGATGAGGNLTIETERLNLQDGGTITTGNFGPQRGGNLNIVASESVSITGTIRSGNLGSSLQSTTAGKGQAGNIWIDSDRLIVREGSFISSSTFGTGNAGDVTITNSSDIELISGSYITSQSQQSSTGSGGNLLIYADRLIVREGSFISASTFGTGNAGDVTITNSSDIELSSRSNITTRAERESLGLGGDLLIHADRLILTEGSFISSSTAGKGDAGNLTVRSSELIELVGSPEQLSALTSRVNPDGTGNGGDITIETEVLRMGQYTLIGADTFDLGAAGDISIDASDLISIQGNQNEPRGGIFSGSYSEAPSGNVRIQTNRLRLFDNAEITVSGQNIGLPGTLAINARSIRLRNSEISSETRGFLGLESDRVGSIQIHSQDLVLRDRTRITTNAFNNATGGDINIDTGVLVAIDNSDITTNADAGNAGIITITADGILGSQLRTRDELIEALGENLTVESPSELLTSDITAISVRDAELNGQTLFNTPDVDSTQGIAELPETVVDPDELLSQNPCVQGQSSEFTDIGRGGFSASPDELPNTIELEADWIEVVTEESSNSTVSTSPPDTSESVETLVPARGWRLDETGRVVLTADDRSQNHVESSLSSISIDRTQFSHRCSPN